MPGTKNGRPSHVVIRKQERIYQILTHWDDGWPRLRKQLRILISLHCWQIYALLLLHVVNTNYILVVPPTFERTARLLPHLLNREPDDSAARLPLSQLDPLPIYSWAGLLPLPFTLETGGSATDLSVSQLARWLPRPIVLAPGGHTARLRLSKAAPPSLYSRPLLAPQHNCRLWWTITRNSECITHLLCCSDLYDSKFLTWQLTRGMISSTLSNLFFLFKNVSGRQEG